MLNIVTANDLKTKGVSALVKATENGDDAMISVRGKTRFVILPVETYNHLRECELEAALAETRKDLKEGKIAKESIAKHVKRISRG